ncbi:hypothetical protein Y10_24700 [Neptunitalea sp. Y10]|uniref:NADH dehydrogenase subunit 6 n=1 Tax=Neptunitalea lumnitzerae TaxID=2965509 RepID=A0ABQ5ML26_9FLAO|nr:hypothetical protein Y10_24700 [Neptunitalea sp. Y10]
MISFITEISYLVRKTTDKFHLPSKVVFILALLFFVPNTLIPGVKYTILPEFYSIPIFSFTLFITLTIFLVYSLYSVNTLLPYRLKSIPQIVISICILIIAIYWFIEIPPYIDYPKELPPPYSKKNYTLHNTINYVMSFIIYSSILVFHLYSLFKLKSNNE